MNPNSLLAAEIVLLIVFLFIEKNPFSVSIFSILALGIVWGITHMIPGGPLWGAIALVCCGVAMSMNIKGPKSTTESKSKKVWLIAFRGQPTMTLAYATTLVFDWPVDIVSGIEFDTELADEDFPLTKPILCKDKTYIEGEVSIALRPDLSDEEESVGEKLQDLANAGGVQGILALLDDMLTAALQEIANTKTSEWMETHSKELSQMIYKKLLNGGLRIHKAAPEDLTRATNFGVVFEKLSVNLTVSSDVKDARDKRLIEIAQKGAGAIDTVTMNKRVISRLKASQAWRASHPDSPEPELTYTEARHQVFDEMLLEKDKYEVKTNKGGVNFQNVT